MVSLLSHEVLLNYGLHRGREEGGKIDDFRAKSNVLMSASISLEFTRTSMKS